MQLPTSGKGWRPTHWFQRMGAKHIWLIIHFCISRSCEYGVFFLSHAPIRIQSINPVFHFAERVSSRAAPVLKICLAAHVEVIAVRRARLRLYEEGRKGGGKEIDVRNVQRQEDEMQTVNHLANRFTINVPERWNAWCCERWSRLEGSYTRRKREEEQSKPSIINFSLLTSLSPFSIFPIHARTTIILSDVPISTLRSTSWCASSAGICERTQRKAAHAAAVLVRRWRFRCTMRLCFR